MRARWRSRSTARWSPFRAPISQDRSPTCHSPGPRHSVTGYATYGGPEMQFRIQATADQVHVEATESVTVAANAKVTLTGNTSRSLLSGSVTILDVAMHSHSDVGSILASAATPPSSAS